MRNSGNGWLTDPTTFVSIASCMRTTRFGAAKLITSLAASTGGISVLENLAWACASCNNYKGSDIATLVGQPPRLSRLYHPRTDRWSNCFRLSGYRIEPHNTPGAATEKLLQFNQDSRLRERAALGQTGRYPTIEALARMKE